MINVIKTTRLFLGSVGIIFLTMFLGCSSSDSSQTSNEPQLEEIEINLVFFLYTPQVGNIPDSLQYEITFTNLNDVGIIGFYKITTIATFGTEQVEASTLSTNFSDCYEIEANSTCTIGFDETGDINLGSADSIEFVSANYSIDSTY